MAHARLQGGESRSSPPSSLSSVRLWAWLLRYGWTEDAPDDETAAVLGLQLAAAGRGPGDRRLCRAPAPAVSLTAETHGARRRMHASRPREGAGFTRCRASQGRAQIPMGASTHVLVAPCRPYLRGAAPGASSRTGGTDARSVGPLNGASLRGGLSRRPKE